MPLMEEDGRKNAVLAKGRYELILFYPDMVTGLVQVTQLRVFFAQLLVQFPVILEIFPRLAIPGDISQGIPTMGACLHRLLAENHQFENGPVTAGIAFFSYVH